MLAAGTMSRRVRPLIVQLTKVAKAKIPRIHTTRTTAGASARPARSRHGSDNVASALTASKAHCAAISSAAVRSAGKLHAPSEWAEASEPERDHRGGS
mgnify:CR=1 FL=1